jgi:hypothetical protein
MAQRFERLQLQRHDNQLLDAQMKAPLDRATAFPDSVGLIGWNKPSRDIDWDKELPTSHAAVSKQGAGQGSEPVAGFLYAIFYVATRQSFTKS